MEVNPEPPELVYVPAGQFTHADLETDPEFPLYVPPGQLIHAAAIVEPDSSFSY